jgi:hypothetical protein
MYLFILFVLPRNPYTGVIQWILEQSKVRTWLMGVSPSFTAGIR